MAVLVVAVVALTSDSDKKTASGSSPASQNSQAQPPPSSATRSATPTPSATVPRGSLSLGNSRSASKSRDADTSGAAADAKDVPLVVLNNTTVSGLAGQASSDFRDGGWQVTRVGNLSNDIISTCAYYDPDVSGAEDAAKALRSQFSGIKRIAEKFSSLPAGPIVVVLTPDYDSN